MTKLLTETYPPIPLNQLVEQVRSFPGSTPNEKRSFLTRLVDAHPSLNFAWGGGWRFRRVRKIEPTTDVLNVSGLLWPPTSAPGRLSAGQTQVFYVADRLNTALREANVEDCHVAVSEFVIRSDLSARVLPIGELAQVTRSGRGFIISDAADSLHGIINACPRDDATSLIIADSFLYDQLAGQDDYEISSFVADALFAKNPEISVIAYPSRKQRGSMNFGVKVDRFWDIWSMFSARRGQARHLAQGYYKMSQITHVDGIWDDGRLTWSSSPEDFESALQLDPPYVPMNAVVG